MLEFTESSVERGGSRAGFVAIMGLPNAGKSSLLNRLLEQKLSIVTPLPQTTRERVVGIDTRDDVQMVFIDTPGLVDPRYLLHRSMLDEVSHALNDADVVVMVLDPLAGPPPPVSETIRQIAAHKASIAVLNKLDRADPDQRRTARDWAESLGFRAYQEVSALEGEGIDELRSLLRQLLPASPLLYPQDEISSQPVRFFVAEFVRETIFEMFKEEVPYSVAVRVDEFREGSEPVYVRATIFVERASQKPILIGKAGAAIRELGERARLKITEFVGAPVYLDLWVKVLPRWRKSPNSLRYLGYRVPANSDA